MPQGMSLPLSCHPKAFEANPFGPLKGLLPLSDGQPELAGLAL